MQLNWQYQKTCAVIPLIWKFDLLVSFCSFMHPYFKTMLSCKWCAIGSCIHSNYAHSSINGKLSNEVSFRDQCTEQAKHNKKLLQHIWCEKALSQIILTAIHSNKGNKNGRVCIIRMTVWRMMYGSELTTCVRGHLPPCICICVRVCVWGFDAQKSNTNTMYHTHTSTQYTLNMIYRVDGCEAETTCLFNVLSVICIE